MPMQAGMRAAGAPDARWCCFSDTCILAQDSRRANGGCQGGGGEPHTMNQIIA